MMIIAYIINEHPEFNICVVNEQKSDNKDHTKNNDKVSLHSCLNWS